jgi:hypothetical protein
MKLLKSDMARDGGSLIAFFESGEGALLSLCLAVDRTSKRGESRRYNELRESTGVRPEDGSKIAKGSVRETEVLSALDGWLSDPQFSDAWGHAVSEHQHMLDFVRALRDQANARND